MERSKDGSQSSLRRSRGDRGDSTRSGMMSAAMSLGLLTMSYGAVTIGPSLDANCSGAPCMYGICLEDENSSYACYCIDGYTGVNCEINWDDCWSEPCLNGGTCNDAVAAYNCTCPEGFVGPNCEQRYSECSNQPCLNNGTCLDLDSPGFTCQCPDGYSGDYCEIDASVCNDTICRNSGVCVEGPGFSFFCRCPEGWTGLVCDRDVDECLASPCKNGGLCINVPSTYTCACLFGFTGKDCDKAVVPCEENPCENGAVCLLEDGRPVCYCVPDYHGAKCESRYDDCESKFANCENGGTCVDGVNAYTCLCPPHFVGDTCETYDSSWSMPTTATSSSFNRNLTEPWTSEAWIGSRSTSSSFTRDSSFLTSPSTGSDHSTQTTFSDFATFESESPRTLESTAFVGTTTEKMDFPEESTVTALYTPGTSETSESGRTSQEDDGRLSSATGKSISEAFETSTRLWSETDAGTAGGTKEATEPGIRGESSQTSSPESITNRITGPGGEIEEETRGYETTPTDATDATIRAGTTGFYESEGVISSSEKATTPNDSLVLTTNATAPELGTRSFETSTTSFETVAETLASTATLTSEEAAPTLSAPESSSTTPLTTQLTSKSSSENETSFSSIPRASTITTYPDCTDGFCTTELTTSTLNVIKCDCSPFDRDCKTQRSISDVAFNGKSFARQNVDVDVANVGRKGDNVTLSIYVRLRTLYKNGIILHVYFDDKRYALVYLEHGSLKFQFSCGLETMLLGEIDTPIDNGHEVHIDTRFQYFMSNETDKCSARLLVNDTTAVSGEQVSSPHLDIPRKASLHMGGIPMAFSHYFPHVAMGFIGCMTSLKINGIPKHIIYDSVETFQIEECTSFLCLSNPCENFGACVEINGKVRCNCIAGYTGLLCERSACDDSPCSLGATCVSSPGTGFLCVCPLGTHGLLCEEDTVIVRPSFSVLVPGFSSYIAYGVSNSIKDAMELKLKLIPRTVEQISLIAYLGQSGSRRDISDHLSITYVRGYIMLTWDLGSGVRRIFTSTPLSGSPTLSATATKIYKPHLIHVGRRGKDVWLAVDGIGNVTGKTVGSMTRLDVSPILYIGGHKSKNFEALPHDLPLHSGFSGCIFDIELHTKDSVFSISSSSPAIGRGVGECQRNECIRHSCKNGAMCLNHGPTYSCICTKDWTGPTCTVPAEIHSPAVASLCQMPSE